MYSSFPNLYKKILLALILLLFCTLLSSCKKKTGGTLGESWDYFVLDKNEADGAATSFAPRESAAIEVVDPDTMILFGGKQSIDLVFDDVWQTTDGKTWNNIGSLPEPLYGFAHVQWDDDLYILGGCTKGGTRTNAIYKSIDKGQTWTKLTKSVPWGARCFHSAVVFRDQLWLFGGEGQHFSSVGETTYSKIENELPSVFNPTGTQSDVWSADKDFSWQLQLSQSDSDEFFRKIKMTQAIVFNGAIYVLGGLKGSNAPVNEIWKSTNGKQWEQVPISSGIWDARSNHQAVIARNKLWILGGSGSGDTLILKDVWSSSDGKNWTEVKKEAPWARSGHAVAYFHGKFWLYGGINETKGFMDIDPDDHTDSKTKRVSLGWKSPK